MVSTEKTEYFVLPFISPCEGYNSPPPQFQPCAGPLTTPYNTPLYRHPTTSVGHPQQHRTLQYNFSFHDTRRE